MKKLIQIFLVLSFCFTTQVFGQTWSSVGNTYYTGVANFSGLLGGLYGARAMAVYNGELYVGGDFTRAGGVPVNEIARWNGISWDSVGSGVGGTGNTGVFAMIVYGGELYVGGDFGTAGGVTCNGNAKWNGTTWSGLTGTGGGFSYTIQNGFLYAGSYGNVFKLNGTSWTAVGSGLTTYLINALASYNNKLYAGGQYLYSWNDTAWNYDGGGIDFISGSYNAYSFLPYNGELYMGGLFTGDNPNINTTGIARQADTAAWWHAQWYPVGSGSVSFQSVMAMTSYNGELIAGGDFGSINPNFQYVAKWNGSSWSRLGTDSIGGNISFGGSGLSVNALVEYKGELYVAGNFGMVVGTDTIECIAKYHEDVGATNVCYGQCNGTASVNPIGGVPPYSFLWDASSGSQTTSTATGLCAGTYTVTVTDSVGTINTYSATISQPSSPLTYTVSSPSICNGTCTTLTGTASGSAPPYIYYGVNDGSVYCPTTSTSYTPIVIDADQCFKSAVSHITVGTVMPTTPVVSLFGPVNFCNGDSSLLSASPAYGDSIHWLHNGAIISGANDSTFAPLSSGQYSVIASLNGCADTSLAVSVHEIVDCDTWPGDANYDSIVDNTDLLPIGLFYGQIGIARASGIINIWQGWLSTNWGVLQSNGFDIKHADCNGDGTIDNNDTLAVNLNFNLTHAIHTIHINEQRTLQPNLYFVTSSNHYNSGDMVDVEVWAGSAATPVSSLYGIAFNIDYDANLVQLGTENLTYPASWLGTPGTDAIKIGKIDELATTAYGAETRITHTNASGFGKIADFTFQVNTALTLPFTLNLSISNYVANDSAGAPKVFNTITDSLLINASTLGINKLTMDNGQLTIYPNPTTSSFTITTRGSKIKEVKVTNVLGEEINVQLIMDNGQCIINTSHFSKGIYFVQITDEKGNAVNRKVVVE